MGIKSYRPLTPGQRFKTGLTFEEITRDRPEKSLTKGGKSKAGRGAGGRISVRRKGGGHKRRFRTVDFRRDKRGIPAKVTAIEYDPNRSAFLALLVYADGEKRYIVAPAGVTVGRVVVSGPDVPFEPGNALPLEKIPLGMAIHNIELNLGRGGQIARSAGTSATDRRQGRRLRHGPPALGRDAPREPPLLRHHRGAGQQGPHERLARQGRAQPLEGPPAEGARHGHEPRRPPARRRRGQDQGRPAPRHAVGPADQGLQDPQEAQRQRAASS